MLPMNRISKLALIAALAAVHIAAAAGDKDKPATKPAADHAWKALFDGKTLDSWKVADFQEKGKITVSNGELHISPGEPAAGIVWDGEPPTRMDYEIELEAMRTEGGDFFCGLTFPVNKDPCTLICGGWGGTLVGLSSIDDLDASENQTATIREFKEKTWYKIRLQVTKAHITAWIDDKPIIEQELADHKISIRREVQPCVPLGISTWRTGTALRNIRLRKLDQPAAPIERSRQVRFREVDKLLANPGQGWMADPRFPSSVVYHRYNWAEAEPAEGQYNWQLIDEAIAAAKSHGAAIAMRVMTANAHSTGYYSSPKWLFDLGCKGFDYTVGGDDPTSGGRRIPRIEPDYADPVYLAKHGAFIAALGKRYDGHPDVEFLDIGSYGIWGEWHTTHPASLAVRKRVVDMYLNAFPKTPLVFMSDDEEGLNYALAHGTGIRRDGVGSPWHEQNWIGSRKYAGVTGMADAWKKAPVVFEWFGDYDYMKSQGWPLDAAVNFMLNNHVSMINANIGRVPPESMPQLEKLARMAGYRFVLREINHDKFVSHPGTLNMKMKWANVGVAKLYRSFKLQVSLRNSAGEAVTTTTVADIDPRDWLPGERDLSASVPIPVGLSPGEYALAVAITDPANQRRPLSLAMDAPEKDGWYQVSRVVVE